MHLLVFTVCLSKHSSHRGSTELFYTKNEKSMGLIFSKTKNCDMAITSLDQRNHNELGWYSLFHSLKYTHSHLLDAEVYCDGFITSDASNALLSIVLLA